MLRVSAIQRVLRMRKALSELPFEGKDVTPLSPLFVRCPFCGAKPLRECTTMRGRRTKFHHQRRQAMRGRH